MNERPFVSVIVESLTTREDPQTPDLLRELRGPLDALLGQSYPGDRFEIIVVLDRFVDRRDVEALQQAYPSIRIVESPSRNYLAAKNAGARAGRGSILAFSDGDCTAVPEWLERLVAPFDDPAVTVVAGKSRYPKETLLSWSLSVPHLSTIAAQPNGEATGFNLSNVAFRRDVLLAQPLDERVRRHGGCYLQFHTLRAAGARVVYEPRAAVTHRLGVRYRYMRKHFERGYDGVAVYRLDERGVLGGSRLVQRFGALALFPITARRIVLDWARLVRDRRQIGIPLFSFPYFAAIVTLSRTIELAGGLACCIDPDRYTEDPA